MSIESNGERPSRSDRSELSLGREVYDRIRHDIVVGKLRPNERLVETDLADRYEASRTPVREALLRLQEAGLVDRIRSGWCVREQTEREIREIYGIRAILEGTAARIVAGLAAKGMLNDEAREGLEKTARVLREGLTPKVPDYERIVEENETFHDQILRLVANDRLLRLCRQERAYYFNFQLARLYSDVDYELQRGQHLALATAVLDGDVAQAEQIAVMHVLDALRLVLHKIFHGTRSSTPDDVERDSVGAVGASPEAVHAWYPWTS